MQQRLAKDLKIYGDKSRHLLESPFFKRWGVYIFATLIYLAFTAYYMGPSITSCATTTYGFGDNTAGPIWKATLPERQDIAGSFTHMTNYPFGDDLYNPVAYSLIIQPLVIGGAQALAGPVCGYNLINVLGFMMSSLVMFGFIYALTKRKWIALLAGYAAAFSPYYQMKVGGHPSYGFQAIFIGLIWLFFRLLKYRRKRDAAALGGLLALSFYFDPYFSLFSTMVILPLGLAWLAMNRAVLTVDFWRAKKGNIEVKLKFKRLLLAAGVGLLLIIPLFLVIYTQGKEINDTVAASRGNVLAEARACSNWPHEYFTPFVLNPVFEQIVGKDRYIGAVNSLREGFTCGIGEDSIGLSLTLVGFVSLGVIVVGWERINKRRLGLTQILGFEAAPLLTGSLAILVVALLIGFPPLKIHNVIPTPSYELLQITPTWRTLARVYMLVNIALVIFASIFLTYFAQYFRRNKRLVIISGLLIFVGVFVEYQAFKPFEGNHLSTFNYKSDAPQAYYWLRDQKNIKVIAEYPLERSGGESDASSYYLTMQTIHGKKLFNSALSYSHEEVMKTGLKNLADPQTIPVLKTLGVDTVVAHGVQAQDLAKIPYARVLDSFSQSRFNLLSHTPTIKSDNIVVLDISNSPSVGRLIELGKGFARNTTIINSIIDWQYEAIQDSVIEIKDIANTQNEGGSKHAVCLDVKMSVESETAELWLIADGHKQAAGSLTGRYKQVKTVATKRVILHNSSGHNMRVTKIGCSL